MLVEWGRPSSTCRRALILPGVRENEGHSRPRRERRARTPDRICLDIDNERRPRSSAMPLLPSAWGRQSALLLSPPTVLFHFFCLHCPLYYAASKQSREDLAFFNAMRFFCLKKAQAKQEFVFLNTIFLLKRNQSSNQSSRQQGHQEGKAATAAAAKAAAAKAAGGRKRRTSSGRTWALRGVSAITMVPVGKWIAPFAPRGGAGPGPGAGICSKSAKKKKGGHPDLI